MTRILVVEDEESFSDPLSYQLRREGFDVDVIADGAAALSHFSSQGADLILLDLMLPSMSGIEVCKAIRKSSDVPIIMVTAKDLEVDKVVGLELGADDYITKPYSFREMLARIHALLRRLGRPGPAEPDSETICDGELELDLAGRELRRDGERSTLPRKEFELLEYLMRNPGRVLTRGQLIDRVWGADYFGDTKTLDVHIKRLRARVEVDPANPARILTVRSVGYRFMPSDQ